MGLFWYWLPGIHHRCNNGDNQNILLMFFLKKLSCRKTTAEPVPLFPGNQPLRLGMNKNNNSSYIFPDLLFLPKACKMIFAFMIKSPG